MPKLPKAPGGFDIFKDDYEDDDMEQYPAKEPPQWAKELNSRLEGVEKALKNQNVRYSWEEKTTDSGIQLAGTTASVTRTGVLLAAVPIPVGPQQMTIAFVLAEDVTGKIAMVPLEQVKRVE